MYLFHGLEDEEVPKDSTEVIIKDGVETIRNYAFSYCESLVKITIPDSVKTIGNCAFLKCTSLRFIQLPPNLQYIGLEAFSECSSLEAVYLSPTVTRIGDEAFELCTSLRILNIPDSVEENIGVGVIQSCESLMTDEMVVPHYFLEEQIEFLRNRYNPLHNLCWDPSVTPQAVRQYIASSRSSRCCFFLKRTLDALAFRTKEDEERARTNDKPKFTALHLLAANPSANGDMITAYLQLAPDVAVMQDDIGMTPLHMLCSRPYFSNSTRDAISSYLSFSDGKEAAFMIDEKGKFPLDYLYENDSVGLLAPSVGGSFSDIMVWWYACLDMNLLVE